MMAPASRGGRGGDLDDVFASFVAEYSKPSFDALCDYLQRYPRYARELIEFTVEWAALGQAGTARSREGERQRERVAAEALAHLHELFSPPGGRPTTAAAAAKDHRKD
jgi:hypothetical protein